MIGMRGSACRGAMGRFLRGAVASSSGRLRAVGDELGVGAGVRELVARLGESIAGVRQMRPDGTSMLGSSWVDLQG